VDHEHLRRHRADFTDVSQKLTAQKKSINNNNDYDNVYGVVIMTKVIAINTHNRQALHLFCTHSGNLVCKLICLSHTVSESRTYEKLSSSREVFLHAKKNNLGKNSTATTNGFCHCLMSFLWQLDCINTHCNHGR